MNSIIDQATVFLNGLLKINIMKFVFVFFMSCYIIFFFFFFYDIDERRRYTKKVHPLKALVGPSIVKRGRRGEFYGLGRS